MLEQPSILRLALAVVTVPILILGLACGGGGDDEDVASPAASAAVSSPAPTVVGTQAAWMKAMLDNDPRLAGVYIPPHPGADGRVGTTDDRAHFATGGVVPICSATQIAANQISNPLCYNSNPPTSGPHDQSFLQWGVQTTAAPKEKLVHNMEHGGVIVWYNTTNQEVITQLRTLVQAQITQAKFVLMTPYPDMEADTIALTAWTRLDKFATSAFTAQRVNDFIAEHNKRFNPENF